jgi:hypothetical protein
MAVTLSTAARNAACDAVVDLVDQGSGAGKVRIRAGSTTLVDITLADPAFGSASAGVATAASLPKSGTAVASGTADGFQVLDSDNNVLWSGTAGTSGTDMILDNTSIASGQTVNLTAFTHTQPAT